MEERVMRLSRRQFTREFKLAAVKRLEDGVSLGEVARALEVNPNVLQRGRREFGKARRGLTARRMVQLSQISRAGFYRQQAGFARRVDADTDLRDAIQRIALEMPSYGRPRR